MKVLVLWADSESANLGVRVLAEGAESMAEQVWGPDLQVVCQDWAGATSGVALGGRALLTDALRPVGKIRPYLRSFDLVLDTGAGDSFSDNYGQKRLILMAYVQWLCNREKVPLVMLPQTIGPFEKKTSRFIASRTLNRAKLVMSRDSRSTKAVRDLIQSDVISSSDLVFALPVSPQPATKRFDVLLNVSGLLWNENPHVDHGKYRTSVVDLVSALESSGRSVCLLPHVLENDTDDNDEAILKDVSAMLSTDTSVVIPKSLSDVRDLVNSANLVIGSRMHACLNALSVGTASIPWAYSRKFKPLLDDLGWPHVIDLRDSDDPVGDTLRIIDSRGAELPSLANEVAERGRDNFSRTKMAVAGLKL